MAAAPGSRSIPDTSAEQFSGFALLIEYLGLPHRWVPPIEHIAVLMVIRGMGFGGEMEIHILLSRWLTGSH